MAVFNINHGLVLRLLSCQAQVTDMIAEPELSDSESEALRPGTNPRNRLPELCGTTLYVL